MPSIQNFWIRGYAEGRSSDVSFGTRGESSGFALRIMQNHKGEALPVADVVGTVGADGSLCLVLRARQGTNPNCQNARMKFLGEVKTNR